MTHSSRFKVKTSTSYGLRTCFEAVQLRKGRNPLVARFGGIPLRRNRKAVPYDRVPSPAPYRHREVVKRLSRDVCEICHLKGEVEVHQVRRLTDLQGTGAAESGWRRLMADKRRKTLIVCGDCHGSIHAGTTP
jgi:hypothetical protein